MGWNDYVRLLRCRNVKDQDPETKKWTVEIERTNGEPHSFVVSLVSHLVFAVGFGDGTPNVPQIPGAVGANSANILPTVCSRIILTVI